MATEQWALVISAFALFVSIGVPLIQWCSNKSRTEAVARRQLLQKILYSKSIVYISMHELIWLLEKYAKNMDDKQRNDLQSMIPRMRTHHDELQRLHKEWSNFDDGRNIKEIEKKLVELDGVHSEAEDTAKLIDNGRRSYEEI